MKVLLVWPRFPNSFWSFAASVEMLGFKAAQPPLGLITVAAMCPARWQLRLVDENVEELTDQDISWADLVMVSAMEVQQHAVETVLKRTRELGRRSIIGGPYASSHADRLEGLADHIVVGEPEEIFAQIVADLEAGKALELYNVKERPGVGCSPCPRFDLLKLNRYSVMSIQFSRGCPFQCEFCDIITIYGRKPRTKTPEQVVNELEQLYRLGWRGETFLVDDNFIGNHRKALELCEALEEWQKKRNFPFAFFTEASINLAGLPDLLEAMGRANFNYVFIGIETPSEEALEETRKFQNLRQGLLQSLRTIQSAGLWVMAGFIVGFDSDDETIFKRQFDFIEKADIPWAMAGLLQAPRNTALYTRLEKEGRLRDGGKMLQDNFLRPNFVTVMPEQTLLTGYSRLLGQLYEPAAFFNRILRSLDSWIPHKAHRSPPYPLALSIRAVLGSMWHQGVMGKNRWLYWKTFATILWRWKMQPTKINMGFRVLASAHHFIPYSRHTQRTIEKSLQPA